MAEIKDGKIAEGVGGVAGVVCSPAGVPFN